MQAPAGAAFKGEEFLYASSDSILVSSAIVDTTISILSNVKWTAKVSSESSWLGIQSTETGLQITASSNGEDEPRAATIDLLSSTQQVLKRIYLVQQYELDASIHP